MLSEKTYIYYILGTEYMLTSGYFHIVNKEATYDDEITNTLFRKYDRDIETLMRGKGILCIKADAGTLIEYCIVNDINPELFVPDVFELLNYQRYGLEPMDDERKEVLQESLKAEKIKQTLVYACYMNDIDRIRELVTSAKKSHLEKTLNHATPLQYCCKHDNLEAFQLLAEKGAKVGKRTGGQTPLEIAFKHSSKIVNHIYSEFPDIFEKEIKKKGFRIALHCQDEALLEKVLKLCNDVNQEGKPFPPLHSFADYNNIVGIKFLLEHGANIECRNQYKQTALHRAIRAGSMDAVEMLLKYGADIHAKDNDGKTAVEVAKTRQNKDIINLLQLY